MYSMSDGFISQRCDYTPELTLWPKRGTNMDPIRSRYKATVL